MKKIYYINLVAGSECQEQQQTFQNFKNNFEYHFLTITDSKNGKLFEK